jgi:Flp pilus assembly protein TadB
MASSTICSAEEKDSMARQGRRSGSQRPVRGFRPGKEPAELRKRRAKAQFGDVGPAQERLLAIFAERSPVEARKLIRRWTVGLLVGGIVLTVLGSVLYAWLWPAGVAVHVLAVVFVVLWWRLHRQRQALEAMANAVGGPARKRRR